MASAELRKLNKDLLYSRWLMGIILVVTVSFFIGARSSVVLLGGLVLLALDWLFLARVTSQLQRRALAHERAVEDLHALRQRTGNVEQEAMLLKRVVELTAEVLPADFCYVVREGTTEEEHLPITSRPMREEIQQPLYRRLADLARGTEGMAVPDTTRHEATRGQAPETPQAALAYPLDFQDGMYGAMVAVNRRPGTFPAEAYIVLREIARQVQVDVQTCRRLQRARDQMDLDPLTGLYNRDRFLRVLSDELRRARRYGHPFTLLMCDIEDMAEYNRLHGYTAGDKLLAQVGDLLQRRIRDSDLIGRWTDDKFALLLTETPPDQAVGCAHRLRAAVSETLSWPESSRGKETTPRPVTIRVAQATYPEQGELALSLIDQCLIQLRSVPRPAAAEEAAPLAPSPGPRPDRRPIP